MESIWLLEPGARLSPSLVVEILVPVRVTIFGATLRQGHEYGCGFRTSAGSASDPPALG